MKRQELLKREIALIILAGISLLLVVVSVVYISSLRRTTADNNRVQGTALRAKTNEVNEQLSYIDTICGEYRKLYGAYKDLTVQSFAAGASSYAIPGSAKGEVDECYQPQ